MANREPIIQKWMVYRVDGGAAPRYRHPDLAGAVTEANRLATENPGARFMIVEILGDVRMGGDGQIIMRQAKKSV